MRLLALALAVLSVPTCHPAERSALSGLGGRCIGRHVDGAPVDGFLQRPGGWFEIRAIDDGPESETAEFRGDYVPLGGDAATAAAAGSPDTLRVHGSTARDARRALGVSAEVFAHTGGAGDPTQVDYAVAFTPGDFAFLGDCLRRVLTEPAKTLFGEDARDTVRGMVGKTGAEIDAVFATVRPRTP